MKKLLTDHMENGFLDNIIDMFRHDKSLYPMIGEMLADDRSRVRVGTVALVETLMGEDFCSVVKAVPGIGRALQNTHPTIRGDAAYLLGIIGHKDAVPYLIEAADDKNELVREAVIEAIEAIQSGDRAFLR